MFLSERLHSIRKSGEFLPIALAVWKIVCFWFSPTGCFLRSYWAGVIRVTNNELVWGISSFLQKPSNELHCASPLHLEEGDGGNTRVPSQATMTKTGMVHWAIPPSHSLTSHHDRDGQGALSYPTIILSYKPPWQRQARRTDLSHHHTLLQATMTKTGMAHWSIPPSHSLTSHHDKDGHGTLIYPTITLSYKPPWQRRAWRTDLSHHHTLLQATMTKTGMAHWAIPPSHSLTNHPDNDGQGALIYPTVTLSYYSKCILSVANLN